MNNKPVSTCPRSDASPLQSRFSRRSWLLAAGATATVGGGYWAWEQAERGWRAATFVARAADYTVNLEQIMRRGLQELGFDRKRIRGKTVLLKPNLVEPSREAPHINTHPAVIRAAANVFRSWDAEEVLVAEGQGHIRDTWMVLEQSGLERVLEEERLPFVDLNHDEVFAATNRLGFMRRRQLHLPRTLERADLIVSMPKMKTHHWAGVTLSMKNLFGVMPGICYGWPKNVLHHCGINQSVVDITATVRPHLAIVDGILAMEGDGPIMGSPRPAGLLVMGANLPAVDATCSRLMGIDPRRVAYLRLAAGRLGPIQADHIAQRGERLADVAQQFRLVKNTGLLPG